MLKEKDGVEVTLTVNGNRVSFESPAWDLGADELIQAFYGLMVTQTFLPETVLRCMKDFAEEHLELYEKEEEE